MVSSDDGSNFGAQDGSNSGPQGGNVLGSCNCWSQVTSNLEKLKNKIFPTTAQPMSDRPTTPRDGTNDRTSSPIPQIPPIETLDRTRWGRQSSTTLNNPPSGSNDDDNDKTKNASIDVSELPNSQRPSAWNQLDGAASSNPFRRPDTPLPLPGGIMRPSNPTHASTSGGPSMPLPIPGDAIRRPYDPTQYIDALEMQDLPLSPRTAEDFPKTPRNTPCAHPDAGEPLTQTESQKSVTFKQNPVDEIRERTPTPESQRTLKTHEKMALIAPGVPASTIAGPSTATTEQTGARDYSTKTEGAEFKKAVSGSQSDTQEAEARSSVETATESESAVSGSTEEGVPKADGAPEAPTESEDEKSKAEKAWKDF